MAELSHRLTLPVIVLVFVISFQISINDLAFESRALPQILILLLGLACIYSILRDIMLWRRSGAAAEPGPEIPLWDSGLLKTALIAILTAAYIASLSHLGFYPATAALLALAYLVIGRLSFVAIPYALASLAIIYVFFEFVLTVQLPSAL